jgi:hypothetical protein
MHREMFTHAETAADFSSAAYSSAAPHTCSIATFTTPYCMAAAYLAASHNTRSSSTVAASYSLAAAKSLANNSVKRDIIRGTSPLRTADTTALFSDRRGCAHAASYGHVALKEYRAPGMLSHLK